MNILLPPCGRFAPTPSGPLHFGSLIAAAGSYLQARSQGGRWLLRMEDVDQPRSVAGAADHILRVLELYGFEWDGEVMYQSRRAEAYQAALSQLQQQGRIYFCTCSRSRLAQRTQELGLPPGVYDGTCRGRRDATPGAAVRLQVEDREIAFDDAVQGRHAQNLARQVGDFVLLRADGCHAYQLATVIDDAAQGVTEIVRGSDLLDSTPRQLYLQRLLGLPPPAYAHFPVAVNADGQKLSKQTFARPLDFLHPAAQLWRALDFLGQAPPPELRWSRLRELWEWALRHWSLDKVPRRMDLPADKGIAV
jgi:glutamyl-Q tRNA(Asp) synthetase